MTTRTLPQDPYIEAIGDALTAAGLAPTDYTFTEDSETRGTYCYLNAVITLDPSGTLASDDEDARDEAAWPHGLLLLWEWHTGIEADQGEPERGPSWQFAALRSDGSNEYPTDLPVLGYASPTAIVEAAQKVIAHKIKPNPYSMFGEVIYDGGIIGDAWERHAELDAACEAWGNDEASE